MVSLPDGLSFPKTASAIARPPSMPGLKPSRIARARFTDGGSTSGLLLTSTTTIGLPVFSSASRRATCPPCISRVAVLFSSPMKSRWSPTTATITSEACAAATAAGRPDRSGLLIAQPFS